MKKFFIGLVSFMLLCGMIFASVPAFAGYDHYQITVYRDKGYSSKVGGWTSQATTGITYQVLTAASELTGPTIYSDQGLTAKTNPITSTTFATDGKIDFYVADTVTSLDIIVTDEVGGFTLFMDGIDANVKNAIIDETPGIRHAGIIWYNASCTATDLKDDVDLKGYDTGIDFPAGFLIEDVFVRVVTASYASLAVMSVGLGAEMAGLIDLGPVDGQGMIKPIYKSDTSTIGSLLGDKGSDGEFFIHRPYFVLTASSLNYAFTSADDTHVGENVVGAGYIHYFFIPTQVR